MSSGKEEKVKMSDIGDAELEGDLRMSPEAADLCRDQQEARDQYHGTHDAPPPRFYSRTLSLILTPLILGGKVFQSCADDSPRHSGFKFYRSNTYVPLLF